MICASCRRTLSSRVFTINLKPSPSTSTTTLRHNSTLPSAPHAGVPAPSGSISISIHQLDGSQPLPPPSEATANPTSPKPSKSAPKAKSSLPGGKELRGLGYTKLKPVVHSMEDDQYPKWLWTLLDSKRPGAIGEKVDLAAMTKKQRLRHDKRQEKLLKDLPKQIPVHEQSKDLTGPGDDAITSLQRRQEITKSARAARRRSIRESNFLKSM